MASSTRLKRRASISAVVALARARMFSTKAIVQRGVPVIGIRSSKFLGTTV